MAPWFPPVGEPAADGALITVEQQIYAPRDPTGGWQRGRPEDPVEHRLERLIAGRGDGAAVPRFHKPRHYRAHGHVAGAETYAGAIAAVQDGWVALTRTLTDGRRQVQHLFLPGDLLLAYASARGGHLTAITPVTLVQTGPIDADILVHPAILRDAAVMQELSFNHIVRLGRQNACERIAHLLLELRDRMLLAGIGEPRRFAMPLTQELLADVVGLTSVHVNRTLQQMRREGLVAIGGRVVELLDPPALTRLADYAPPSYLA